MRFYLAWAELRAEALLGGTAVKKVLVLSPVMGAFVLATLCGAGPAQAKKLGEWTCYDFLKAPEGQKSRIVYFFQGINLADKKDTLELSAKSFNVPVSQVVQHCQKNRSMPLWDAIITHFNLP
jgi:hypothetical protein